MTDATGVRPDEPQGVTPDQSRGETPEPADDIPALREALRKANGEAARFRREHSALAQKLKDAEDADKNEVQKATEKLTAAESRAAKAEARLLRIEVAIAKGLPPSMAGRLQGETQEELEADADELLGHLAPAQRPTPGDRPREALRSGTAPDAKPEETDPKKLAGMIPRV
jgi:seryl-tRNA synthetase